MPAITRKRSVRAKSLVCGYNSCNLGRTSVRPRLMVI